jgi:hypothetical protein
MLRPELKRYVFRYGGLGAAAAFLLQFAVLYAERRPHDVGFALTAFWDRVRVIAAIYLLTPLIVGFLAGIADRPSTRRKAFLQSLVDGGLAAWLAGLGIAIIGILTILGISWGKLAPFVLTWQALLSAGIQAGAYFVLGLVAGAVAGVITRILT